MSTDPSQTDPSSGAAGAEPDRAANASADPGSAQTGSRREFIRKLAWSAPVIETFLISEGVLAGDDDDDDDHGDRRHGRRRHRRHRRHRRKISPRPGHHGGHGGPPPPPPGGDDDDD